MTVNKITNPPSQKDLIDKTNEIIDALGASTGANIDLSNLSATGEAHFQKPLTAGTDLEIVGLPSSYTQLKYIQGNNNVQYINTGIVPTSSMNMYVKTQYISVDASTPTQVAFLMGARDVGGQYGLFLQLASTSVGLDWFVVNGRWSSAHTREVGDVLELKVNNSLAEIWLNGTSVGTHQYTPNDTTQYPLFLNALNNIGQAFSNVNVVNRIYRFTINGVADMIPAKRDADGVIGMYDVIRNQFFVNAGTGTFTAGPEVSNTLTINFTNDTGYITSSALAPYVLSSSLATVATSGSYNDLTDKPTIPTVNNATLTIQKNGTTVNTFTANASSNVTANITVPTDTSDLTNGAGYITGITSGDITTALGYTPYNSTNPNGYISGITSGDVTTALGYTPYNSSNPNGYTSNIGTITSVNGNTPDGTGAVTVPIPTVNDATLTINQGGTLKGTFTANASSNITIDLENSSQRNLGEIVASAIPLTDAGLHLLDGSLINGSGIYSAFVDYIADLYDGGNYPNLFVTEADWQTAVTTYGVCGKFVYDSVANTVRLPKITGILEGTTDVTALGDLVEAGLPNIKGTFTAINSTTTAPYSLSTQRGRVSSNSSGGIYINEVNTNLSTKNSIYGNSTTVQPQTTKCYYYIVIATTLKTEIQIDIDEVTTDLNGKLDTDGSNAPSKLSSALISRFTPDYANGIQTTLTTAGQEYSYTCPSAGAILAINFLGTDGTNGYVRINGVNVGFTSSYGSGTYNGTFSAEFIVNAGDVVTAKNAYGEAYLRFCPMKGAN